MGLKSGWKPGNVNVVAARASGRVLHLSRLRRAPALVAENQLGWREVRVSKVGGAVVN